jgi:hypothetical protein
LESKSISPPPPLPPSPLHQRIHPQQKTKTHRLDRQPSPDPLSNQHPHRPHGCRYQSPLVLFPDSRASNPRLSRAYILPTLRILPLRRAHHLHPIILEPHVSNSLPQHAPPHHNLNLGNLLPTYVFPVRSGVFTFEIWRATPPHIHDPAPLRHHLRARDHETRKVLADAPCGICGVTIPVAVFNNQFSKLLYRISDPAVRALLANGQGYEHASRTSIDRFGGGLERRLRVFIRMH